MISVTPLAERAIAAYNALPRDAPNQQALTAARLVTDAINLTYKTLGSSSQPNQWMPHGAAAVRAVIEDIHLEVRRAPLALYAYRVRRPATWRGSYVIDYAGPIGSLEDLGRYLTIWQHTP